MPERRPRWRRAVDMVGFAVVMIVVAVIAAVAVGALISLAI